MEGNQLDEDKVYELLCQAVTDGKTEVNLEESDCYLKPKKTSDNKKLKKKLASLQKYWDMTVTYEIGDASISQTGSDSWQTSTIHSVPMRHSIPHLERP